MRNWIKWATVAAFCLALVVTPAMAKKKQVERRIVDGITLAEVKPGSQLTPYYPATARVTKAVSNVTVSMQVKANGRVGEIEVLHSSVEGLGFEEATLDTVKAWRFMPAEKNGEAIDSVQLVNLTFVPPTLGLPDGNVFARATPNPWGALSMDNVRDVLNAQGYFTESSQEQARIVSAELPPCSPGNAGQCTYQRNELRQFQTQSFLANAPGTPKRAGR